LFWLFALNFANCLGWVTEVVNGSADADGEIRESIQSSSNKTL